MKTKKNRYKRKRGGAKTKKWLTAIKAGEKTYKKTGSLKEAKKSLRSQALINARKLFGSI